MLTAAAYAQSHVQPWPGLPTGCLDHGVIAPIPQKMRFTESVGVYPTLCLQRIVAPVLQIIVALTLGVLFGPFFLRYMSLAVRDHLSHMVNIILLIFAWMLLRVLRQDGNDAAPGLVPNRFAIGGVLRPARALGFLAAKPFFEFLGGHVDNVVELPVDRVSSSRWRRWMRVTNPITVSLSLTMMRRLFRIRARWPSQYAIRMSYYLFTAAANCLV